MQNKTGNKTTKQTQKGGAKPPAPPAAETQAENTTATAPATDAPAAQPVITLFGQLPIQTVADFDEYIARMKQNNWNDVLVTVNVAIRSIVLKGGFTLEENEAISVALRQLNSAFTVKPTEEAPEA